MGSPHIHMGDFLLFFGTWLSKTNDHLLCLLPSKYPSYSIFLAGLYFTSCGQRICPAVSFLCVLGLATDTVCAWEFPRSQTRVCTSWSFSQVSDLFQHSQPVCSRCYVLKVWSTSLIHTSTIEQLATSLKKASTTSTTGLMTEHGIHWAVLLVVSALSYEKKKTES